MVKSREPAAPRGEMQIFRSVSRVRFFVRAKGERERRRLFVLPFRSFSAFRGCLIRFSLRAKCDSATRRSRLICRDLERVVPRFSRDGSPSLGRRERRYMRDCCVEIAETIRLGLEILRRSYVRVHTSCATCRATTQRLKYNNVAGALRLDCHRTALV